MKNRFAVVISTAAVLVALLAIGIGSAAPPTGNKPGCFDGSTDFPGLYGGTCTKLSPNRFFLDTNGGDPDGEYAGVAVENSFPVGTPLASIDKLSFNYSGTTPGGGAPRISIGVDEDGDGTLEGNGGTTIYDGFAFAEAATCNDGAGRVDVINDPTCLITYGANQYENWAAFLAAYPNAEVGYEFTFVVADAPGEWTIWNVQLGAKSRGGK